ncbi:MULTISPECIES: winged helix-turn-helix domain-containing protein [Haloferax]|uniref:Helix-turn-helix domain protein n=1 Tax=Haloferax massiliensis TaxID=1476858 RepID=A0A0D6JSZ9_9EURY|nr:MULTISPECIES: helix-turn-helix domain-containing protein [Haloferax]MDS0241993.1 helix-turn-helix domain-containing protein [Haloferax sp. S2CR25]MDS0445114.1 helix-turn-helix domain-containing protein [Haloferax sp. S2CR25-2]CQR51039.1 Helix-turn-helix domain protein [Haloferax massiliensis]
MNASSVSAVEQSLTRNSRRSHVLSDPSSALSALSDGDSRRILAACDEAPRTAQECAELCDVPLSSVYRKLDQLTEASLLDERLRIQTAAHHPREFATNFDTLSFSFDDAGVSLAFRQVATDGGEDGAEGRSR